MKTNDRQLVQARSPQSDRKRRAPTELFADVLRLIAELRPPPACRGRNALGCHAPAARPPTAGVWRMAAGLPGAGNGRRLGLNRQQSGGCRCECKFQ
jgi:hypothetical protein